MSSSTPSSEAVRPPRASLDSLPTELKKRIVELCAEQDERFKQWTHHFEEQVEQSAGLEMAGELDDLVRNVTHRQQSSIGSLFCLSRQWSELAAPFRFKVRLLFFADCKL